MASSRQPEVHGEAAPAGSRVSSGLIGTVATNALLLGIGLATSALAARLMGPGGRGSFAAVQNIAGILSVLALAGMPDAVTYLTSRHPEHAGRWLATATLTAVGFAVPLVAGGAWLLPVLVRDVPPDDLAVGRYFLLWVFASIIAGLPYHTLQGSLKLGLWNAIRLASPALWLIVLLVAWWSHPALPVPAAHVMRVYLAGWAVYTLFMAGVTRAHVAGPFVFSGKAVRELLRYGVPCALGVLPRQLNIRLDQLLMAALLPHRLLGLYAAAVAWSNALVPLVYATGQVAFPSIAGAEAAGRKGDVARQMVRLSVLITAGLLGVWACLTPVAFLRLVGEPFREALPLFVLLLPAAAVAAMNAVCAEVLKGLGRPKDAMAAELAGLGVTVVLLSMVLTRYGLWGASGVSLVSYVVSLALNVHLMSRATSLSARQLLVPTREDVRRVVQARAMLRRGRADAAPPASPPPWRGTQ